MILTEQKESQVLVDGESQESIRMSLNSEIWKDIQGYEGYYQISNLGRVRSLDRIITRSNNRIYTSKGKLMSLCRGNKRYLIVVLYKKGKYRTMQVHQLVAFAFLNHKPKGNKIVVNHKDFNTINNNVNNLEIITARENTNQKHRISTSIYTGVSWDKRNKKWKSAIRINGKVKHLGFFSIEEEASKAYERVLKQLNNQ